LLNEALLSLWNGLEITTLEDLSDLLGLPRANLTLTPPSITEFNKSTATKLVDASPTTLTILTAEILLLLMEADNPARSRSIFPLI